MTSPTPTSAEPVEAPTTPDPAQREAPRRFRKKPVVIEAMQFTGDTTFGDLLDFFGDAPWEIAKDETLAIPTLEGVMTASRGDWIIKGVAGEFYPCKPDIFEQTYEDALLSASAPVAPAGGYGWRPEVAAFANLMEQQLRANDHKPGWKGDEPDALFRRLVEESSELEDAIYHTVDGEAFVGKEAADVANFAMMIADVCGALTPSAPSADLDALTGCADDQGMFAQPNMDAPSGDGGERESLIAALEHSLPSEQTKDFILTKISTGVLRETLAFLRTPPTAAPAGDATECISDPNTAADFQARWDAVHNAIMWGQSEPVLRRLNSRHVLNVALQAAAASGDDAAAPWMTVDIERIRRLLEKAKLPALRAGELRHAGGYELVNYMDGRIGFFCEVQAPLLAGDFDHDTRAARAELIAEALNSLPAMLAAPSGDDAGLLREAALSIQRLKRSIMIDVGSCHANRGPGAGSAMREDDRDLRNDMEEAFAKIDAALSASPAPKSGEE